MRGLAIYGDNLFVSTGDSHLMAFDARNGKLVWTFYTVPAPGEVGHDTWPSHNDTWKHGGAAVWQTPA